MRPTVKIIIGGPSADDPEFRQLNTCGVIDAIVKGEGEATIVELMHRIENHLPLKVATGTAFGPAREPADISMLPQPDLSDLASLPYVTDTQPIQFSRGCPARCAFCTERLLWPNFRRRSAESAVSEIENRLLRTTSRSFLAVDSLLNADLRWLEEVTDRLIARELDIKWGGNMRVHSRMRRKLFGQLRRAGMAHAVWGVESGSRRILRLMNKGIEPNTSLRNVRDCSNAGIITIINILVGFPGETRVDFQLTCELLARMWRHIDGINLSRFWPGVEFDWGIAPAVPVEMGDARKAVLEPAVAALIEESALREHVEGLLTPIVGPSRARNIALRRCRQSRPVLEQLCDWSRAC